MSKLRKISLLLLSILMCISLSACFLTDLNALALKPALEVPEQLDKATVIAGIDGDTVVVRLENGSEQKVRLLGVNTPELGTKTSLPQTFSQEASDFTKSKLLNKTVYLEKDVSDKDKFDRLLRYIWLKPPEEITDEVLTSSMFNAILLTNGYANTYTLSPDTKYRQDFTNYLKKAKNDKVGVWAPRVTTPKKVQAKK